MTNVVRIDDQEVLVQEDPMTVGIQNALKAAAKKPVRKNTLIDTCARNGWKGWDKRDEHAVHADMEALDD